MINVTYPDVTIPRTHLQKMLYDREAIKALAIQIVAGQVEAHLDMINDAGVKEYGTFQEVDSCIQGAKESVEDYIEDLLTDFRGSLYDAVRSVKVETKALIQKPNTRDGIEIDADVNVTIE